MLVLGLLMTIGAVIVIAAIRWRASRESTVF